MHNDSGLPKEMLDLVLSKGRENHLMVSEYNRNGTVEVTDRQGASNLRCDSLLPLELIFVLRSVGCAVSESACVAENAPLGGSRRGSNGVFAHYEADSGPIF